MSKRDSHQNPAWRIARESRSFLQEEKFETWLDLSPLLAIREAAQNTSIWTTDAFKAINHLCNPDSLCTLSALGRTPHELANSSITPVIPAMIMKKTLSHRIAGCYLKNSKVRTMTEVMAEATLGSLTPQLDHILSGMSPTLKNLIGPSHKVWYDKVKIWPRELMNAFYVAEDFSRVLMANKILYEHQSDKSVIRRGKLRVAKLASVVPIDDGWIAIPSLSARICLALDVSLLEFEGETYLLNKSYLLEIINKANELYCAVLYTHMLTGTVMPSNTLELICKFWQHIATQVARFGNRGDTETALFKANTGFRYLKIMEGLGVSVIIQREDQVKGWDNVALTNNLWQSVIDDRLVINCPFEQSVLGRLFHQMTVSQIAECIGTVKLAGHPSIEIANGLKKLYERTHANIEVDEVAVQRGVGILIREVVINFRRTHGRYPLLQFPQEGFPLQARHIIENNRDPDMHPNYRQLAAVAPLQWSRVELLKNEEFDPVDNQLVLLKDKALGLTRSKVIKLLASAREGDSNQPLGPIEERRALLSFLLSTNYSQAFTQYLERFEHEHPWSKAVTDYLVIKLTAKELEEKPEGRFFGASPMVERNRRVVQESNVMNFMDNYLRDQLMTPNELYMIKKMFSFRHFNRVYPHHVLLQLSIDFKNWNHNFRVASVDVPADQVLGRWFGRPIFGRTMEAFGNSLLYYIDWHVIEEVFGQLGGIEGLNQPTWAVVFIGGLKQALETLGYYYQLTVKGDDVRAAIAIDKDIFDQRGPEAIKGEILEQLRLLCESMGWKLNPHESYVSQTVIATSKQYQVNNTWLPASIKKACKLESLANLVFPTLEDVVSSIFSTAHSACSQATVILPAFVSATMVASRLIYRECFGKLKKPEEISAMLIWPQCMGGPGCLPLQTFFVRGENDMLSVSLSLLRFIVVNDYPSLAPYVKSILSQEMVQNRDFKLLLSDPYSIPIDTPERPQSLLKRLMRKHLKTWTKNPQLIPLLTKNADEDRLALETHLLSMRPYVAKVATALYEVSPFYIIDEVLSRFMESATIFAFFSRKKHGGKNANYAHKALKQILNAADCRQKHWIKVLHYSRADKEQWLGVSLLRWQNPQICTTELVHEVRTFAWKREIVGLTYPSLIDQNLLYHPSDLGRMHPNWDIINIVTNIQICHKDATYESTEQSMHYASAPGVTPWLGAQTSRKLTMPKTVSQVTSPTISKIMKLLALKVNSRFLGTQFTNTVDSLLGSLTHLQLDGLEVIGPESGGGHITHRVAINSFSLDTMPNYRPNLNQLIAWPRDSAGVLTGDQVNRTVNFAARHFMINCLALFPLQSSMTLPENYPQVMSTMFHYRDRGDRNYQICEYCCNAADEQLLNFDVHLDRSFFSYRLLQLVGCSPYEEWALRNNMQEAIAGRVKRYLADEEMDLDDPINIMLASNVIMHKLNLSSNTIFNRSLSAGFSRVPNRETLETMSAALGMKSVLNISRNTLRAIPPNMLYRSILALCIDYLIDTIPTASLTDAISIFQRTMPHLNPLSGIFSELAAADRLMAVQQGCRGDPLGISFSWGAGCDQNGATAAQVFMAAHEHFFIEWLRGQHHIFPLKFFLHMESNESITDAFTRKRFSILKTAVSVINVNIQEHNIFSFWKFRLRYMFGTVPRIDHPWQVNEYPNIRHPDLLSMNADVRQEAVREHVIPWLMPGGVLADANNRLIISIAYIALYLDSLLDEGDWDPDHEGPIRVDAVFQVVTCRPFEDVNLDTFNENWIEDRPYLAIIAKLLPLEFIRVMYDILLLTWPLVDDQLLDLIDNQLEFLYTWARPISTRRIALMTQEDAEIILKRLNRPLEDILEEIVVNRQVDDADDVAMPQYDDMVMCHLRGHGQLPALRRVILPGLLPYDHTWDYTLGIRVVGLQVNDPPPPNLYWVDETEYCRNVGIHNTSISKYISIIVDSGVDAYLEMFISPFLILCLADGLGGVTAALLTKYPLAQVLYNSLMRVSSTGRAPQDTSFGELPNEVRSLPNVFDVHNRLHWRGFFPGDLSLPEVQSLIVQKTQSLMLPIPLITFDADISWEDNLSEARQLWMGFLNIVSQIGDDNTVIIMKMFAVHNRSVYEVLHLIISNYHHHHIHRPVETRSRSTEMFVVFSHPKNREFLHRSVELTSRRQNGIPPVFHIVNDYMQSLNAIGAEYLRFRLEGSRRVLNLHFMYQQQVEYGIYPLNLPYALYTLGLRPLVRFRHICAFLDSVSRAAAETAAMNTDQLHGYVLVNDAGVRYPVIRTRTGGVIARGWKFLQVELVRAWKAILCEEYWRRVNQENIHPYHIRAQEIVDAALNRFIGIIHPWVNLVVCVIVDGSLLMCGLQYTENLSYCAYTTLRKCTQVLGSYYLVCKYVAEVDVPQDNWFRYWYPTIACHQCCIDEARDMYRDNMVWSTVVQFTNCLTMGHPGIQQVADEEQIAHLRDARNRPILFHQLVDIARGLMMVDDQEAVAEEFDIMIENDPEVVGRIAEHYLE
ncbi:RNA-dependent RNA polymerase [Culverton virus]|uniref:RNA-directed RNA polymerase n=1 Tax=Culverton virus TaxID=2600345 RepID=A0A5B8XEG2_9VIRU|nr:RNA-dependent RNA polymerase [Culverton virus]QED21529.1 RNA-dependent RNA polymerase [Culverton virus]